MDTFTSSVTEPILIVSAHWETAEPTVTVVDRNDTINVFQMFPEPMPQLRYPAPGSSELTKQVMELLIKGGFEQVKEEKCRGLDHGAWVPLILTYMLYTLITRQFRK